jgi:hypothetical protein
MGRAGSGLVGRVGRVGLVGRMVRLGRLGPVERTELATTNRDVRKAPARDEPAIEAFDQPRRRQSV